MTSADALAVLDDALKRCATEDMRTDEVSAALAVLQARSTERWPFEQFLHGLMLTRT